MSGAPILTIAVPTHNMENYLRNNLESILAANCKSIEVLVLDNSSTDASGHIADTYAEKYPQLFTVIHKENRGYGSSVNWAIEKAKGRYLRIVDADDWVDSEALAELEAQLKGQTADLILTPYRTVNMKSGKEMIRSSAPADWKCGDTHFHFCEEVCPVPQMHGTIFRVDFLREMKVELLENAYYVDEQLMLWTYMCAQSACKIEPDVYRYRVGNEMQSISSRSMSLRWNDRERVIRSCIERQRVLQESGTLKRTCSRQLTENIGNHFTTLYMYVTPRNMGCRLAKEWREFIKGNVPDVWVSVKKKAWLLSILCLFHVSPMGYEKMKRSPILRSIAHI